MKTTFINSDKDANIKTLQLHIWLLAVNRLIEFVFPFYSLKQVYILLPFDLLKNFSKIPCQ